MESHEALERFEKVVEGNEESRGEGGKLARTAAIIVAVLAAFLAVATYLGNQATTKVITDETKGADTQAQLEANDVKTIIAGSNALLLRVVGTGNPKEATAVAGAKELESRVQTELKPHASGCRRTSALTRPTAAAQSSATSSTPCPRSGSRLPSSLRVSRSWYVESGCWRAASCWARRAWDSCSQGSCTNAAGAPRLRVRARWLRRSAAAPDRAAGSRKRSSPGGQPGDGDRRAYPVSSCSGEASRVDCFQPCAPHVMQRGWATQVLSAAGLTS
jgi:hypothetical protein